MNEDAKDGLYKQQTAVEYLVEQLKRIGFSTNNLIEFENEVIIAKEMEKEQIIDAIKNELKLIGTYFDVSKLETKEQGYHIRFTAILKDRFDYYNEKYVSNKCQFEVDNSTSSATKCKWCGQEKWQHKTYGGNK